jgi:TonB-dependent starch-binding outer membrane protein SusC
MNVPRPVFALLMAVAMIMAPSGLFAQNATVTGRVVDQASLQPLDNVIVTVVGTNLQALTNQQGNYTLANVPVGARTIRVSRIGYRETSQQVEVTAPTTQVSLEMAIDPLGLDEIVVVGYGEARRRNVAGAVSSLRAAEVVASTPVATVNSVLQGRMPGVQVTHNSGQPGAAISVRIRGASSISAGNTPLYVIDGVPMVQGNFSQIDATFGGQGIDALADLNPNDIETIQVLKDASAAAIYGSRASNGVVLITTKRGIAGRSEISFSSYAGVQSLWRKPEMLNAEQFRQVYDEGLAEAGVDSEWFWPSDWAPTSADTDWIAAVTRTAPISNYEASIRGGTDRVRYFVNGTMFLQDGVVGGFAYDRINGRVNLDYQPTSRLSLGTNVALTRGVIERGRSDNTIYGPWANALATPPTEAIRNEDGSWNLDTWYSNPVALMEENDAQERSVRILGNAFGTMMLTEGVTFTLRGGLDQYMLRSRLYDSPVAGLYQGSGRGIAAQSNVNAIGGEATMNFERQLGVSNFSGVVGTGYSNTTTETASLEGNEFPSEQFRLLTSAAVVTGASNALTESSMLSFFGRLSWNWNERITATFNIRTDGSSRFGSNNRYGTFPSASVLWRLTEEAFMQDQGVFSDLAVRASYGRTGNQQGIGNFAARGLFGGSFNYNDQAGIGPTQIPNPDLKWETTDQLNLGADLGVLNDRLGFSVDYYVKTTNDLLLNRPLPRSSGYAAITQNVGSMENRGIEFSTRATLLSPRAPGGFGWTADVNIARNRNKVTGLLNDEDIFQGLSSSTLIRVGQPLGVFYGYVMDGIFQSEDEVCYDFTGETCAGGQAFQNEWTTAGDVRFRDINGDGIINADDRTIIGNPWPKFEGGVNNTINFRGIDLTGFVQFSYGGEVLNAMRSYTDAFGSGGDNHTTRALRRWTPENPSNTEPRATWFDDNANSRLNSSRFIEDGSYLRLKNVVLGYTLPTSMADRIGFRSVRVYVQGQNLVTWTNYSGFDPEVNYVGDASVIRGVDFYTQPQLRTITAGFNVGL